MRLSPQQVASIQRSGQDVCCVAGPGSGKTSVLVERFAWLVGQGLDPQRILAITFTEKAANNIKDRLVTLFAGRERPDILPAVQRAPVSTIHGFCASLLREHALAAGLDPAFRVLDELETQTERWTAIDAVLNRFAEQHPDSLRALYESWAAYDPASALLATHEAIRMGGGIAKLNLPDAIDVDAIVNRMAARAAEALDACETRTEAQRRRAEALTSWLEARPSLPALDWVRPFKISLAGTKPTDAVNQLVKEATALSAEAVSGFASELHRAQLATLRDILVEFDVEYAAARRRLSAVDFTDLEEKSLALLSSDPAVRKEVQQRYEAVLMDEVQDTNPLQWEIVNLVRREQRFFAVGDVNQSIYGFRHARPDLFESFQAQFDERQLAVDRLETNYRSRPEILEAVNAVAAVCPGVTPHKLYSSNGSFPEKPAPCVEMQAYLKSKGEDGREDRWLIQRLMELKQELGITWRDIAILSRSTGPLSALEISLIDSGVPYLMAGGGNYFDRPEVIDLLNWLRVLDTPRNEIALYALLRSPFFGHSDESMFALRAAEQWPPADSMDRISQIRDLAGERSVAAMLAVAVDECGYLAAASESVRSNVDKFLTLVRLYEARLPVDIGAWVRELETLRKTARESNAPSVEVEDAVQLLTIHKAKGLEFKVVAILGMHRNASGDNDPLSWTASHGLGASWLLPGDATGTPDSSHRANRESASATSRLEEDRLLYVAMTRAEQHLVFSCTLRDGWRTLPSWAGRAAGALNLDLALPPHDSRIQNGVRVVVRQGTPDTVRAAVLDAAREVVEIDRLREAPQSSPAVSVTALVHFLECPRRSLLERVLGWPGDDQRRGGTGATDRGAQIHELLAGEEVAQPSPELVELKAQFDQSDLGRRAAAAPQAEREFDFLFSADDMLIRGSIDLWFEDSDGEIAVVDYKTGHTIRPELQEAYESQLRLYALALEKLTGKLPARGYLALLDRHEVVEVLLGDTARLYARTVVENFRKAEQDGVFEMRPGRRCEYCPFFKGACASPWNRNGGGV